MMDGCTFFELQTRGDDMAKISYHDFITILCHVGFTILSEQCKDKAFQGNKI